MAQGAAGRCQVNGPADISGQTIAAVATAPGPAGIAIVRISGPEAWPVAARVVRPPNPLPDWNAAVGRALHVRFVHPISSEALEDGLLLVFRAPHSYTGENVVELLELHGGAGVAPPAGGGAGRRCRLAEPGEFTRRAFLNGRLDLTQAEAVLDLIQARTDRAAQAPRALDGRLGSEIRAHYATLAAITADIGPCSILPRRRCRRVSCRGRRRLARLLEPMRS